MSVRPLASADGRRAWLEAVRGDWLLAFDFDGTLAPLTDDPGASAIPPAVAGALDRLARRRCVAVVSGRARSDLLPRVPGSIAHVIGNHGCEGFPDHAPLPGAVAIVDRWYADLVLSAPDAGLRLEDKGPTLSLHWRGSANPRAAQDAARLVAGLDPPPHLIPGKEVLNLLPPGLPDKGWAVRRLRALTDRPGVLFVGDDVTDGAVFRLSDERILGIEVGDKALGAGWRVPDTRAVGELVAALAEASMTEHAAGCDHHPPTGSLRG